MNTLVNHSTMKIKDKVTVYQNKGEQKVIVNKSECGMHYPIS